MAVKDEIEESLDQEPGDVVDSVQDSDVSEQKEDKKVGPTVEELATTLDELKSELGKKSKEIGDLRQDVTYERELRAQLLRDQQRQPVKQEVVEDQAKFDIEQPDKSIDARIDRKLNTVLTYQQQVAKQSADTRAQKNYYVGIRSVDMEDPLYKGIERDVQNMVYQGYQAGIFGMDDLDKPSTWEASAKTIRANRDGWSLVPPEKGVKPMKGATGESPRTVKKTADDDDFPVEFNDKDRALLRAFEREGVPITEDEAKKIIRSERATGKRR